MFLPDGIGLLFCIFAPNYNISIMKHRLFISICILTLVSCAKQSSQSEIDMTNSDSCVAAKIDTVTPHYDYVEAIDLGLSVLWADRNLGASEPADCGGYYPSLKAQDTIAALLGDGWRLPTVKEMEELYHNTDWWNGAFIDAKGVRVKGRQFVSKRNGKDIFLPSAGFMRGRLNIDYSTYGAYITSTHTFNGQYNKGMWGGYWDDEQEVGVIPYHEITVLSDKPDIGYTIRPVKNK